MKKFPRGNQMHTMINILNATCPKTAFLLFIFVSTIWFHEKLDQNNYIIIEFALMFTSILKMGISI